MCHNIKEVGFTGVRSAGRSRKLRNKVVFHGGDVFVKRKGNVLPVARGDAKCHDACMPLTLVGDSGGRGPVGERRALMGYAILSPCSVMIIDK